MSDNPVTTEINPQQLADQIENYFRLVECGRCDGKTPFELTVDLLKAAFEKVIREARDEGEQIANAKREI